MSDTKYGDQIPDEHWEEEDDVVDDASPTTITNHEIDVILTTDPHESGGYGRKKYSCRIRYDEETGEPYVLYAVGYRWKGNYWRDTTDWDWRDLPGAVRQQVAAALPVDDPEDLDSGTRLMDEGGESRWEKHHKRAVRKMDGDEMWGVSFLRDALDDLETAAEAFDDGTKGKRLTEKLVATTQKVIRVADSRHGGSGGGDGDE
jgi:hypothetical protein